MLGIHLLGQTVSSALIIACRALVLQFVQLVKMGITKALDLVLPATLSAKLVQPSTDVLLALVTMKSQVQPLKSAVWWDAQIVICQTIIVHLVSQGITISHQA